jgi:hypothetical protein
MWNVVVWACAMLANAAVLEGVDGSVFVAALLMLIVGAAGTDALLVDALPQGGGSAPPGPDEVRG